MKFALICPNEPVLNGYRVAQVEEVTFPVGDPTYWMGCADDVVADQWYFNTATQQITIVPPVIPTVIQPTQDEIIASLIARIAALEELKALTP
jgi:hypothetical protein